MSDHFTSLLEEAGTTSEVKQELILFLLRRLAQLILGISLEEEEEFQQIKDACMAFEVEPHGLSLAVEELYRVVVLIEEGGDGLASLQKAHGLFWQYLQDSFLEDALADAVEQHPEVGMASDYIGAATLEEESKLPWMN